MLPYQLKNFILNLEDVMPGSPAAILHTREDEPGVKRQQDKEG